MKHYNWMCEECADKKGWRIPIYSGKGNFVIVMIDCCSCSTFRPCIDAREYKKDGRADEVRRFLFTNFICFAYEEYRAAKLKIKELEKQEHRTFMARVVRTLEVMDPAFNPENTVTKVD